MFCVDFYLAQRIQTGFCITEVESAYCAVRTEPYIEHTLLVFKELIKRLVFSPLWLFLHT